MATYAERLRDSLTKFKVEEYRFSDGNGEEQIRESHEQYPICFFWFSSVMAGIALHIISLSEGEELGIEAMQKVLFRRTMEPMDIIAAHHVDEFLTWLLDQEAPEGDLEAEELITWYSPGPIIDLYNKYVDEIREARNHD